MLWDHCSFRAAARLCEQGQSSCCPRYVLWVSVVICLLSTVLGTPGMWAPKSSGAGVQRSKLLLLAWASSVGSQCGLCSPGGLPWLWREPTRVIGNSTVIEGMITAHSPVCSQFGSENTLPRTIMPSTCKTRMHLGASAALPAPGTGK